MGFNFVPDKVAPKWHTLVRQCQPRPPHFACCYFGNCSFKQLLSHAFARPLEGLMILLRWIPLAGYRPIPPRLFLRKKTQTSPYLE